MARAVSPCSQVSRLCTHDILAKSTQARLLLLAPWFGQIEMLLGEGGDRALWPETFSQPARSKSTSDKTLAIAFL